MRCILHHDPWGTTSIQGKSCSSEGYLRKLAVFLDGLGITEEDVLWGEVETNLVAFAPEGLYTIGDLERISKEILEPPLDSE